MKWRDLTCQDADDFDALLNFACLASDFACGDTVALVPSGEEMVWQSPVDMCALVTGADVVEKKIAHVLHVENRCRWNPYLAVVCLVARLCMRSALVSVRGVS